MESGPFHNVNVVGPFGWHDIGVVEMNLHVSPVECGSEGLKPWSIEVRERGSDIEEK